MEEVTADVVEKPRELELEVQLEDDGIAAISRENFNRWGAVSYRWEKKMVSWMECTPGEDAVQIVEMMTKALFYFIFLNF